MIEIPTVIFIGNVEPGFGHHRIGGFGIGDEIHAITLFVFASAINERDAVVH